MAEIYQLPETGNNNSIPFSINSIADLFGLAIIASMFGWGNNGFGGFGGWGGNNGAGFLSNQLNNDSGRELIMNAITSQGEASRSAIQNLATTLGQDFNLVNSAVQNVQNGRKSRFSVPEVLLRQPACHLSADQRTAEPG